MVFLIATPQMAPKKKPQAVVIDDQVADVQDDIPEIIEEVVPEQKQSVTFVLDDEIQEYGEDDYEEDDDEGDDIEEEDPLTTAVGQLTQLMMTEEGEAITDVLHGLRDAIDKQNKIMYRGLQLLEARFGGKR